MIAALVRLYSGCIKEGHEGGGSCIKEGCDGEGSCIKEGCEGGGSCIKEGCAVVLRKGVTGAVHVCLRPSV